MTENYGGSGNDQTYSHTLLRSTVSGEKLPEKIKCSLFRKLLLGFNIQKKMCLFLPSTTPPTVEI